MRKHQLKIAIIGAGFSGIASAYFLARKGYRVKLYEYRPIGENASGISAGLLHYYTGIKAKPPKDAKEKLQCSIQLLDAASVALNRPVYYKTGLFRPALNDKQAQFFQQTASEDSMVSWLSADAIKEKFFPLYPFSGIWIENGFQVDTKQYLSGLWKACEQFGAEWRTQKVKSIDELQEDLIVIATGASPFKELSLPIHPVKGQILEIEWNHTLFFPISGNIYLVPGSTNNRCFIGGTFEHRFAAAEPNIEIAKSLLIPKLHHLCSDIKSLKIIKCQAALRASTPNRKPILKQINTRTWILAGMGSKGLLNHAYYASRLEKNIVEAI